MPTDIAVGSVVFKCDPDHRVYLVKDRGPDYRSSWVKRTITGETMRSWITNYNEKIPKRGPHYGWAFTEQEVDSAVFVHDHAYRIAGAVQKVRDAEKLKQIAAIVEYDHAHR